MQTLLATSLSPQPTLNIDMTGRKGPTLFSDGHQASKNVSEIDPSQSDNDQPTKKKKRRVRSDLAEVENGTDPPKNKSKKRKERRATAPETDVVAHSGVQDDGRPPDSRKRKHSEIDESRTTEPVQPPLAESQIISDAQIDPELLVSSANPSTSVFLSAVLAAASAMTEASNSQNNDPQVSHPPDLHPPTLQLPPDQAQHSGQQPFPSVPLSEVSNDDILRVLQDLDISKIASVLKTLNDAAHAANISLVPPHEYLTHVPMPTAQPILIPILPLHTAPPGGFIGQPSMPTGPQRQIDMTPPTPQSVGNPHHAQLLCTKWLNAAKLAELVETEGRFPFRRHVRCP